jgi:hypothetical protein
VPFSSSAFSTEFTAEWGNQSSESIGFGNSRFERSAPFWFASLIYYMLEAPMICNLNRLSNSGSARGSRIKEMARSEDVQERMTQGQLSIESLQCIGRLVQREREASLRSPKPFFRAASLSWITELERTKLSNSHEDAPDMAFARSISDSLSDAAFTMELGECDVTGCTIVDGECATLASHPYKESPYCFSFCGLLPEDRKEELDHDMGRRNRSHGLQDVRQVTNRSKPRPTASATTQAGDNDGKLNKLTARTLFSNTISSEVEAGAAAGGDSKAQSSGSESIPPHKAFVTPTNIEDAIGNFAREEGERKGVVERTGHKYNTLATSKVAKETELSAYYKQRRLGIGLKRSTSFETFFSG